MRVFCSISLLIVVAVCGCVHTPAPPYRLKGNWHTVEDDDTLERLARRYRVDEESIKELNDLSNDADLRARQEVFIPRKAGKRPGQWTRPRNAAASPTTVATSGSVSKPCGENGRPCLRWPVAGALITQYTTRGANPHDGIDIKAAKGTEIGAAADGVVLYSGNQIKGYGNLVILKHVGGIITVYAHNAQNRVKEGDKVTSGQTIATLGDTGVVSVPHLHFEVRDGEKPLDPMLYLPK